MTREEAIRMLIERDEKMKYADRLENIEIYNMAIEALKEQRQHEKWEYLKEHITEMRDADGKLNQKQTCQFILNLMGVIEREGEAE